MGGAGGGSTALNGGNSVAITSWADTPKTGVVTLDQIFRGTVDGGHQATSLYSCGNGGGGGATLDGAGTGGAGGSGGGCCFVACQTIAGAGTIEAKGAAGTAGGAGGGAGSGGGGGGGGGLVCVVYSTATGTVACSVTGGAGGAGAGSVNTTGGNGHAGLAYGTAGSSGITGINLSGDGT
jgi:hypothetical protein